MNREPVLIILNGLAGVVSLALVAAIALGLTLTVAQAAAVVAVVAAFCNLVAAALRGSVISPATHEVAVLNALATPWPTIPGGVNISVAAPEAPVEVVAP